MVKLGAIIIFIIFLAGIASIAQVCEIDTTETKYRDIELTYDVSLEGQNQDKFLFLEATEVQYLIQNTDTVEGTFTLNFIFRKEEDIKTNTRNIKIAAGAQKAVTEKSSFNGVSEVQLNVIPPTKQVPYEVPVKKKVTMLKKLLDLIDMYNE